MHRFSKILTGMTTAAVIGAMAVTVPVQPARAQQAATAQGQQKKKNYKDQGEYDIYAAVSKEADWNKKLALLDTWKQKYPESDFKQDRLTLYLVTYQNLKRFDKVMEVSKEILAVDPKDIQALYWISFLTPSLAANNPSADALDTAEKAANGLLAAEKPANTPDAAWATAKKSLDATAHKTLGWVAMVRKNYDVAQQQFQKSLGIDPNAGEVSYWLGTVLVAQKKPELQPQALYYFARAAAYDGPGALAPAGRQMVNDYLTKAYNSFHGADPTLDQIKTMAKTNATPPADFKIKTKEELDVEAQNKLQQDNPALALWLNLKKQLQGPDGANYFQTSMKGAAVPGGAEGIQKFKGKLIEAKPAVRSKELVVALADGKTPEVTLKLNEPLTGKPEIGSDIAFEGVPTAFSPDPFMVTFDVEKDKIEGLKVERVAPTRRPVARKGVHKKA